MGKGADETDSPLLVGDTLQVIASRSGAAISATVVSVEQARVRVRTSEPLAKREQVRLRHVVTGDARYTSQAVVEAGTGGTILVLSSQWRRHQQRDSVRLRLAKALPCEVRVLEPPNPTRQKLPFEEALSVLQAHVVDLSASGALLETPRALAIGEQLQLAFDLNDAYRVHAEAMVVRQARSRSKALRAGVRFRSLARGAESQIVGYINAAQAERRRTSLF